MARKRKSITTSCLVCSSNGKDMKSSNADKLIDTLIGEAVLSLLKERGPVTTEGLLQRLRIMKEHEKDPRRRETLAVVIAEIGWPSAGKPEWNTTIPSERLNYNVTKKWVSGANSLGRAFDTYWFEMFDEPWKTNEGPFGPYFGLYDKDANPKWSPL